MVIGTQSIYGTAFLIAAFCVRSGSRAVLVTRPRSGALKIPAPSGLQMKHRWNGLYIIVTSIVAPRMFNSVTAHLSNPPAGPPP